MSVPIDAQRFLERTERTGLILSLRIRNLLILLVMVLILVTQGVAHAALGIGVVSLFLFIGIGYSVLVRRGIDRPWMRYAFTALDVAMLGVIAAGVPLSIHGDVPQIFVFRTYGVHIYFFLLAMSALSLSPRLVLWTGGISVATIWASWGWIVAGMDRVVTWAEISDDRSAENYIRIVLDPDHIMVANRVVETMMLITSAIVIAAAVARARRMLRRRMEAEEARSHAVEIFGRFVPEEVTNRLTAGNGVLPADEREATVLFVDIESFTTYAEGTDPEGLMSALEHFFDRVSDIAARHRGTVVTLIGDAAMVAFNAPLDNDQHAAGALRAGRDLLDEVDGKRFGDADFRIRIGIATGRVAAGTIGGRGRRAYTLYGDTVNQAQRLEALNKDMGTRILVSHATWESAGRPPGFTGQGRVRVKGRGAEIEVLTAG